MEAILTKQECNKIFEEVKSKATKQQVEIDLGTVSQQAVFQNATINLAIKRLEKIRNEVSISYSVPADQIKTHIEGWNQIRLYIKRYETDDEVMARVRIEASEKIKNINNVRRKKILEEAKKKEKDKKELARIVANLGPEIYEVFEQIKRNENDKQR